MQLCEHAREISRWKRMSASDSQAVRNKELVLAHFEAFVNERDLDAIDRNLADYFVDHDGPGGKTIDRAGDKAMMAAMHARFPDLSVEVRDVLAEDDKVVVRNVWTGTDHTTGERITFRGFVLWRIADNKIVERWATVTPFQQRVAGEAW